MTYLSKCMALMIMVCPFGIADTAADELSICAKKEDSLQRLVCYDKLAEKAKNIPLQQKTQQQLSVQDTTTESLEVFSSIEQRSQSQLALIKPNQADVAPVNKPKIVVDTTHNISQQQATFGYENKQSTENLIDQIKSTITKVKKDRFGSQTITLDNGQVWQQTSSTRLKFKRGQSVIIDRGALGSFFIGKENINKRIRAKRVI